MFTLQASKFDIYVHYCTNKPKSTEVLMAAGDTYFQVGCQNNRYHQCPQHSCCFHSPYLYNIHQNCCWLISVIMTITNSTILNIISSSHHLDNHHYLHLFHHNYYFLSVIILSFLLCDHISNFKTTITGITASGRSGAANIRISHQTGPKVSL